MVRTTGPRGEDGRLGLEYHLRDMGTNAGWRRDWGGAQSLGREGVANKMTLWNGDKMEGEEM